MKTSFPSTSTNYHWENIGTSIVAKSFSKYQESTNVLPISTFSGTFTPEWADEQGLNASARLVLFDLVLRQHPVAGIRGWAKILGLSDRTVTRAVEELVALGAIVRRRQGHGLPTVLYLNVGTDAEMQHPCAEMQHPGAPEQQHPCAEMPQGDAEMQHPNAQIHQLRPSFKKEKEDSLLKELSKGLSEAHQRQLWSSTNGGGRVTLERSLAELAVSWGATRVIDTLLAAVPASGIHSIVGFLITRCRRLATETPPATPSPDLRPTSALENPSPVAADPVVAFALVQARSVQSVHEVASVRRGIELEFGHDASQRNTALRAFEEALAV